MHDLIFDRKTQPSLSPTSSPTYHPSSLPPGSHDYYLKVQANDGGSPSLSSHVIVAINVTDENDNVPTFNQKEYSAVVRENAQIGEEVIQVGRPALALGRACAC